ncbi:hypothetical protein GS415_00720 [Rhodococcus hoagii]|nr:hypothetical protein [Prescottella equi]
MIDAGRLSPASLDTQIAKVTAPARTAAEQARDAAVAARTGAETARDETVISVGSAIEWTGQIVLPSSAVAGPKWIKARLIGNTAVSPAAGVAGKAYTLTIEVSQDATGGRSLVFNGVSWPIGIAPAVSSAPNARDLLFLTWTGSDWIGTVGAQSISIVSAGGA